MSRWLLVKLGAGPLAKLGLALVIGGLLVEALLVVEGLFIETLSHRTDKILSGICTVAIALGVWWEYVGHEDLSRPRTLNDAQKEALIPLLKSDLFQKDPKPSLRIAAVSDAEAQMYAMQFMQLLESCTVNIYPTNGGLPVNMVQSTPSADGLQLMVKNKNNAHPAFVQFQRLVHSLGIALPVGEDPSYRENEATLEILRKG